MRRPEPGNAGHVSVNQVQNGEMHPQQELVEAIHTRIVFVQEGFRVRVVTRGPKKKSREDAGGI